MVKSPRVRPGIPLLLSAISALSACSGSPSEPHGSPILTKVFWAVGGDQFLVWSKEQDPAQTSPVPPFAAQIDFVFDRRLDGTRIEDIVTVGGVMMTHPVDPPAVRVTWPGMADTATVPPFSLVTSYDSTPRYGGMSSFVFTRPQTPGFPSDTTVSFQLVTSQLANSYGELATVPESIPVITKALDASVVVSGDAVAPTFLVPLAFTNRLPPAPAGQSPFVHVKQGAVELPYKLFSDANLASRWFVAPADCLGGAWPAGAALTVTIDAGITDAFGGELGKVVTATFSTSAGASHDAACAAPDGGASDAAADDGPG